MFTILKIIMNLSSFPLSSSAVAIQTARCFFLLFSLKPTPSVQNFLESGKIVPCNLNKNFFLNFIFQIFGSIPENLKNINFLNISWQSPRYLKFYLKNKLFSFPKWKTLRRKFFLPLSVWYHTPPSTIKFQINSIYFIFFILFVHCAYITLYILYFFFFRMFPCSFISLSFSPFPPASCHHTLRLNCLLLLLNSNKFTYTHSHILCCYYCGCVSLCSWRWKKKKILRETRKK